ncbi:MAG TPA: D-aminoacyl-tRNA deacylase [Ignavibacteria bacterium]|nr:D-aminoacyl-tRNA deacylase [Ignavibacteria bacterium]
MIAVIQRVLNSNVVIDGKIYSEINKGLMVLLGVKKGDTKETGKHLANKILDLRIFEDENGKMNLSVKDVQGEILVISQFTLCTDKNKSGNRPSFTFAEEPQIANEMYEYFVNELKQNYDSDKIKTGVFAADMKVNLTNDGPVTIILEKE